MAAPSSAAADKDPENMDSESLWDEMEVNYFESMRLCHEKEDRDLEDNYRVKSDVLKNAIIDNYGAQLNLQRQLQALKDQYNESQAKLRELDDDVFTVRAARAHDREIEMEKRRLWFRTFRRGGLAYRPVDGCALEPTKPLPIAGGFTNSQVHGELVDMKRETVTVTAEMPAGGQNQRPLDMVNKMEDARPLDEDDDMEDVEGIEGPELPTYTEAPRTREDSDAGLRVRGGDHEANGVQAVDSEEPAPLPILEAQRDDEALDSRPAEEDEEMEDIRMSTENSTNGAAVSDELMQTIPPAPPSPSPSSELSSRHTTPDLDSPVSMPNELSRPPSPDSATPGAIKVLDGSGGTLGWLQAPVKENHLLERLMERPIQRPVQLRSTRKLEAEDLHSLTEPMTVDARPFKWIGYHLQARGQLQEQQCHDCSKGFGPFQGCVMVDDQEFPRCANCEWNKRNCLDAAQQPRPGSRRRVSIKPAITSPTPNTPGGGFKAVNGASPSQEDVNPAETTEAKASEGEDDVGTKKKPRKSLPSGRKALPPSTPLRATPEVSAETPGALPEITRAVLCLRDDGVVFTDPPMMHGVPLKKITPDHPYWEEDWMAIEKIVEPQLQKHQDKYDHLESTGSKHRDKHLANRDAKRGRTILKFLEEGDLHPYQLVGKEWINHKITNYDTLYRLAQLLLEELPRFNLDVTPSEWLRQRLHEVYLEKGPKFNVAAWIEKAYHDPKIEQAREKNGLPNVGRPPAHRVSKGSESTSKRPAPRQLKRKDTHSTPVSTSKQAPHAAAAEAEEEEAAAVAATPQPEATKSKIIKLKIPVSKKPRITIRTPSDVKGSGGDSSSSSSFPNSAASPLDSALEYDGYTSTDSISRDGLMHIDFRVHQVKTSTIASNNRVTQYWHWLGGAEGLFEHQVLRSVRPAKWSVFKDPYDFHLRRAEVREVVYAKDNKRVVIKHKRVATTKHRKVEDADEDGARGDIMAQFKRERTKRRFLMFLKGQGVALTQVST